MSDLVANLIASGGVGAMLFIAGFSPITTAAIGVFTLGGLVGIQVAKKNKNKGE